eukprot:scaffold26397_cov90-Isochrysis_galbana.AAC.2
MVHDLSWKANSEMSGLIPPATILSIKLAGVTPPTLSGCGSSCRRARPRSRDVTLCGSRATTFAVRARSRAGSGARGAATAAGIPAVRMAIASRQDAADASCS